MVHKNPNTEILVLDSNGTNLGLMLYRDAKTLANNRDLDLVQVNKDGTFKIMDHGKYKYNKKKNQQKKISHPLKEMTFKMRIDPHDAGIKVERIKNFLLKGSDVKIAVTMRGRERASPHLAQEKLDSILNELDGLVVVQQKKSGKSSIFVTVRPVLNKNKSKSDIAIGEHNFKRDGEGRENESHKTDNKSLSKEHNQENQK